MAEAKKQAPEAKEPTVEAPMDRNFPEVVPGVTIKVHQEITDLTSKGEEKKRIQIFEGIVLQRKHGNTAKATVTVRKDSNGFGVERIFPLRLATIKKIEVVKKFRVRRAKIGYIRGKHKKMQEVK
ncbi:MAG: 50S ribosomal protein L19 [Parcubacteria group bacterium GW2011_GWC2_38_7]|nr:MAG: 50S ribosomal protein L19 [Parcubacteria group bacterium GW2011_GWC2_38_7]